MEGERYVLRNARALVEGYLRASLREGDRVVDATTGNGGDTLWLCGLVGEAGHVYAFDVQPQALERAQARLRQAGLDGRATFILDGHEHMARYVGAPVQAAVFNLGWLPGGDHAVTTRRETTLEAAQAALRLLAPGGLLSLCVYPGHEEGMRELRALLEWSRALPVREYNALHHCFINAAESAPNLILIQKNA